MNEARDWKVTKKTSEGHGEDVAKLFWEEEEGLEGHEWRSQRSRNGEEEAKEAEMAKKQKWRKWTVFFKIN